MADREITDRELNTHTWMKTTKSVTKMADNVCSICDKVILIAVEVSARTNCCRHCVHYVLSRVMSDLLESYRDWLPTEIQEYIMLFAFSQHRIDIQRRLRLNELCKEF